MFYMVGLAGKALSRLVKVGNGLTMIEKALRLGRICQMR